MIDENLLKNSRAARRARTINAAQVSMNQHLDEGLSAYQQTVAALTEKGRAGDTSVIDLSQLDQALQSGKTYETDLQGLVGDLTDELMDLGRNVETLQDLRGMEKVVDVFSHGKARKMMLHRIKSQGVEASMRTVLHIARGVVISLDSAIERNQQAYVQLERDEADLDAKLKDNQPRYEEWREKRVAAEQEIKEMDRRLEVADESKYAELQTQRTEIQGRLDEARLNEDQYFAILKNAKEALPIVRQHKDGFRQAIGALSQNKITTQEKVANLTAVFENVWKIIETAVEIKGFSRVDQAVNLTADRSTAVMNQQVAGILAETAARAEHSLVDPARAAQYREALDALIADFDSRMNVVKGAYAEHGIDGAEHAETH